MNEEPSSARLVRLLADDARRRVVAAMILEADDLDATMLAARSGLSIRVVVDALARLQSADLVVAQEGTYHLDETAFERAARAEAPPPGSSEHGDQPEEIARVLDAAFKKGRLVQWPSKRSRRLVVLDHLAQQFEIGIHYSENEVNDRLRVFDDDVATMRRYLVDEAFLDRTDGEYWRCGGTP